jgi:hypothetical protein
MVERGGKIKKDHGGGEDNRADNESGIPMAHRMNDEKWRSDERAEQPYAVADTVGDLFARTGANIDYFVLFVVVVFVKK